MSETPILNAPVYEHGYVTGRYLTAVADGPDADRLMDFTPAKGKVIFTPETVIRRHEGPSPALVVQRPVECPINSQGYLTSPDGWRGVSLIVGIYSVRFEVQGAQVPGPKRIQVKETHTQDAPLDLVLSMPEVVPPGSVVVVDETTAQRAEAAAARAEAVVTNLESEVRAVVLASPELKGERGEPGEPGEPGPPGAVPTSSDYLIVGPGRPDQPATTNGVIKGSEPVGAEYRSTDGAGAGLFDWMKRPTGWVNTAGESASAIKVGGVQPTSGWWLDSGNVYVTPTPDTVAPVAGTLTVTTTSSKATLTVSGASDDRALNSAPYSFSKDNGITWSGWQSAPSFEFTGLASGTTFTFRHRVRDAEGNVSLGAGVAKATAEQASAYRDAVLALAPSDYYPMDDAVIPGQQFRNLGNGSPLTRTINAPGTTVGAPGIGDGATSAAIVSGGPVIHPDALAGATKFTATVLVDVVKAGGKVFGALWDTMSAEIIAGPGVTPMVRVWADSKNLNVVTPAVVTGRHMLTFTYDGTTVRFYWDGQLMGQANPTTWTNGYPSKNTDVKLDEGRAAGLAFFRGKTLTDAQVQSLYAALPAA